MRPLVSAHRGGVGADRRLENTEAALARAVTLDCEYVEFDVQRCKDGTLVLYHDDVVTIDGATVQIDSLAFEEFTAVATSYLTFERCLALLAGKKRAHVDLKFTSPAQLYRTPELTYEVVAAARAIEVLGADAVIVTTLEDRSVAALRAWSATAQPGLLVGLSLGRNVDHLPRWRRAAVRRSELFPTRRMAACGANLLVAHRRLARSRLARWAERHDVPLLVWTVDEEAELAGWLADDRVWMVTTNYPELATRIRAGL